jgi:hypothetical protein
MESKDREARDATNAPLRPWSCSELPNLEVSSTDQVWGSSSESI